MSDLPEERISLGEAAYRRLRADIVRCRLEPGQRLTVEQLTAETGFGASPLREALTRLAQEGLVRTLPRKGYLVSPLTPKTVDDLLDLWGVIGPEVVRRGVARATLEQKQRVAAGFEEIDHVSRGAPGLDTATRLIELLDTTFLLLAELSGNDYLIKLVRQLAGDLARVWMIILAAEPAAIAMYPPDLWVQKLVVEQDPDAAAEMAHQYLKHFRAHVRDVVARWPSVATSEIVPLRPGPSR